MKVWNVNLRQSVSRILAYLSLNILGLKTEKESYNSSFTIELSKFKSTWTRLDSNCNIEFILIENNHYIQKCFFSFCWSKFYFEIFSQTFDGACDCVPYEHGQRFGEQLSWNIFTTGNCTVFKIRIMKLDK